jgi:hypothetical protein
MNSYYLITFTADPEKSTLDSAKRTAVLSKSVEGRPNEKIHMRYSLDRTKAIFQGVITAELKIHITQNAATIQYLGDMLPDGQAEQKVHDFIAENSKDWESVAAAGIACLDSSNNHIGVNYINDHDIGLQDAGTTNANNYSNNYIYSADTPTDIDVTSTENNNITV